MFSHSVIRVVVVGAAVAGVTAALAGCAGSTTTSLETPPPVSSASPTSPTHAITPTAAAAVPGNPAPSATPERLTPDGNPYGTINSYVPEKAKDSGPGLMAHGAVTYSAAGVAVKYTVAAGDDYSYVAKRLGLEEPYLYTLNSVRRSDFTLYVGDVLNLDPTTIASVGAENGVVSHNPLPDGAPAQH